MRPLIHIFSDASFDSSTKSAVLGYLIVEVLQDVQTPLVRTVLLENTTNSRAEIEAALLAIDSVMTEFSDHSIVLYTDSKTLADLPKRKSRLVAKDFRSGKSGLILSQADLYKRFYLFSEKVELSLKWIKGHTAKESRGLEERLFSRVDKKVREELRRELAKQ
jgi:ribonuclease HI